MFEITRARRISKGLDAHSYLLAPYKRVSDNSVQVKEFLDITAKFSRYYSS